MLAFGLTLLVSVAAAPPPAHAGEKLASTYDEASCDPADGGECAEEPLMELPPAAAAILDCQSPLFAEMIGSCDLPQPMIPTLHLPTLRPGGNGFSVAAHTGSGERLTVVRPPPSADAALPLRMWSPAPARNATRLFARASTATQDAPRARLDRPPRS